MLFIIIIVFIITICILSFSFKGIKLHSSKNLVNEYLVSIYGKNAKQVPKGMDPKRYFISNYNFVRVCKRLNSDFIQYVFPAVLNPALPCPFFRFPSKMEILNGKTIQLGEYTGPFRCGFNTWTCPKNSFLINIHDPKYLGRNIKSVPDNSVVEITHKCCNSPSIGNWVNVVHGSGIFYNVGKTLRAFNKVDAAFKLGISPEHLARLFPDFPWYGWNDYHHPTSWYKEKTYIAERFDIHSLPELLRCVASGEKKNSAIDFISNCPVLDELNCKSAREQNYDSIQMSSAGYTGYWSFEIQDTRKGGILDLIQQRIITTADSETCITTYPAVVELACQNTRSYVICDQTK